MDYDQNMMIMMREKLVQELERGKESATQITKILDHHHHHDHHHGCLKLGQLDAHSMVVFTSFANALSVLHNFAFCENHPKDGRRCYKRRKSEETLSIETSNTDDGYAWRKYGQKAIQHSNYPRNYYRCTHKNEQGCLATKQVQQISENPTKFKIIYNGHHTCKDLLRNPNSMLLDFIDEKQDNPPNLLSFEEPTKHGLNPFMSFPSSSSSTLPMAIMGNAMVDQEYKPHKEEIRSEPLDCPSSSDLTTITARLSSTNGVEEDYSYMMAESIDFNDVFQDYFDPFA